MNVKRARELVGLSKAEVCRRIGVPRRSLENWESGVSSCPKYVERLIVEKLLSFMEEKKMKNVGYWWNDKNIELVDIGGTVYALDGWNGEKYTDCWKCSGEYLHDASKDRYELTPIYRFEAENIDIDKLEENSDEWDSAMEIVDYSVF